MSEKAINNNGNKLSTDGELVAAFVSLKEQQKYNEQFSNLPVGDGNEYFNRVVQLREEVGDDTLSSVINDTLKGELSSENITGFNDLTDPQKLRILELAAVAASEKAYGESDGEGEGQVSIDIAYQDALERGGPASLYIDSSNDNLTDVTNIAFRGKTVTVKKTTDPSTGEITGFGVNSTNW